MKILTLNNQTFDLNDLPDEVTEDMRFSVMDNSSPADPDFFFMPLIFLESFNTVSYTHLTLPTNREV
mgnify:CR=1 FL=1